jgi:hypothetical protein
MDPSPSIPERIDAESVFSRPDIYPVEFTRGQIQFVPMTPDSYRKSIFTDRGRIVPAAPHGWQVPIGQVLSDFERRSLDQPPLFFIFHIAHCGSTLLARAIDIPGRTLVIREPFTLRQLAVDAAAPQGPRDPATWNRCLRLTTVLLGRRYAADQAVIVKANVPVNFMLPALMKLHRESRGLLLHTGLDNYLLSVLKTPMHRRWIGNVTRQLTGAIRATPGLEKIDPGKLNAPEAAACLWLAQLSRFRRALADCNRLRSLDCQLLFDRPAEVLQAALEMAGASLTGPEAEAIAGGELFRRHAKDPGRAFDREARTRELAALSDQLAPELDAARNWVKSTSAGESASVSLGRPLL